MAPYSIVPPHVLLAGIGVALVDVGTDVLIVPLLPDAVVMAEIKLDVPISSVPPDVVFNVVIERLPPAVFVPEVLSSVRVP